MDKMDKNTIIQYDNGYLSKTPIFQFILLSCLFPLWAAAASLNDVLITQFKSVFALSDFASALVQSAFYSGYFLISIPASIVIRKTTYKTAILTGLGFYIAGCCLFFPASHMATYTMFLVAIFAIAIGLGCDRGTPVYATGDAVVEAASTGGNGGYGHGGYGPHGPHGGNHMGR